MKVLIFVLIGLISFLVLFIYSACVVSSRISRFEEYRDSINYK